MREREGGRTGEGLVCNMYSGYSFWPVLKFLSFVFVIVLPPVRKVIPSSHYITQSLISSNEALLPVTSSKKMRWAFVGGGFCSSILFMEFCPQSGLIGTHSSIILALGENLPILPAFVAGF